MEHNAGEIVELAVRRQNLNIKELSRRLNINRWTLYNWFRQKRLPTNVILEIGEAINYDFSNDFEGELNCFSQKVDLKVVKRNDDSDHVSTVLYWMEKYIALLEEYNSLVRSQGS